MLIFIPWIDESFETMGNHSLLVFTGETIIPGLLKWCRIRPSTVSIAAVQQLSSATSPLQDACLVEEAPESVGAALHRVWQTLQQYVTNMTVGDIHAIQLQSMTLLFIDTVDSIPTSTCLGYFGT